MTHFSVHSVDRDDVKYDAYKNGVPPATVKYVTFISRFSCIEFVWKGVFSRYRKIRHYFSLKAKQMTFK